MVGNDEAYISELLAAGIVQSPCLETGAGFEDHSARPMLQQAGIEWFGTDLKTSSKDVLCADLEAPIEAIEAAVGGKRFATVLLLNVLEHVFDPIRVLDNVCSLASSGGHVIVIVPTVWPLHYYPIDCWRINPNFFEEYCRRRNYALLSDHFRFVTPSNGPVDRSVDGHPTLPPPTNDKLLYWRSKIVHRVFNSFGRGMSTASLVSTGAVIRV